jgi:hypothetical protein
MSAGSELMFQMVEILVGVVFAAMWPRVLALIEVHQLAQPAGGVSISHVKRQRQLSLLVPGTFMRASVPSPSRSCSGNTAVLARERWASAMRSQWISRPSLCR